jgi:hypothetical protein
VRADDRAIDETVRMAMGVSVFAHAPLPSGCQKACSIGST